jgi:enterochelin esterase-like enzyme
LTSSENKSPLPPVDFRTFEVSDPRFEHDYLRCVTVHSPAMGRRGDITFFVPPGLRPDAGTPLAILLHGSCGSHWAWALQGGAHRTALRLIEDGVMPPLVLAMPSDGLAADTTAYIAQDDSNFESWIVDDVVACSKKVEPAITEKSRLFLGGLSMGGFGAMHLGLKHAPRFAAVSAHSSVTDLSQRSRPADPPAGLDIYRFRADPELSVLYWAKKKRATLPRLRFDCGVEDPMLEHNRTLHSELEAEGVAHTYEEFPGGHTWEYWELHIEDTLRFFAKAM